MRKVGSIFQCMNLVEVIVSSFSLKKTQPSTLTQKNKDFSLAKA